MDNEPIPRTKPIGLHSIIATVVLVAVIGLLLVVFYRPFPVVTIINTADVPLENVTLQTEGSETLVEIHELGTLEVGEVRDVTVRSYEVRVLGLDFDLDGERIEFQNEPLPLTQGQTWRLTVEPGGDVISAYGVY